jgi:CRP/FNR family transcriptional regulator, cyclic AMP receptor protein
MSLPFIKAKAPNIAKLLEAIKGNSVEDSLARFMPEAMWPTLAEYLDVEEIERGHVLTAIGAYDQTLYFLESGKLRVHYGDSAGQVQIASLGPGSVVGEGAFFSQLERSATVQAYESCRVWSLTPGRFKQLSKQHTAVALALAMALGAVVSVRMLLLSKRMAAAKGVF